MAAANHWFTTTLNGGLVEVGYDMSSDGDVEGMCVEFSDIKINSIMSEGDFADIEMECYADYEKVIADSRLDRGQERYEARMAA